MANTIGIIGGSGFYDMEGFSQRESLALETPFGTPSAPVVRGTLGDVPVLFIARHGEGHRLLPHEVPYRANVHALKQLGADVVLGISAVGSLREEIEPGHLVFVDQYIDRSWGRPSTFFGEGCVAHVAFGDPVCHDVRETLVRTAAELGFAHHERGSFVCMQGPQFSTRAESELYRSWGADVIGMTNLHEARLCREAELCYAAVALATDYDCWRTGEEVSVEAVIEVLRANIERAKRLVARAVASLATLSCSRGCRTALENAIMTDPRVIPESTRRRLEVIAGRYLQP
ncbi:MAG: S-methyl-5'-thioadenosine phosphorylase [Planctomycetota bacterium]|nr:MAG: S-methyl-5'-thioadenosine phosphorylase [Planctomycetota bacterium]